MEKMAALVMIFFVALLLPIGHCAEEVEEWFEKLPYAKEKVTKFHFFMHDKFAGKNAASVRVAHANITDKSPNFFGLVFIMDDPIREGMKPTSKELGRAQGMYAFSGQEQMSLLMAYNLVFTTGEYNGSTLTIMGRNPALPHREMPVIGGSGVSDWHEGLRR